MDRIMSTSINLLDQNFNANDVDIVVFVPSFLFFPAAVWEGVDDMVRSSLMRLDVLFAAKLSTNLKIVVYSLCNTLLIIYRIKLNENAMLCKLCEAWFTFWIPEKLSAFENRFRGKGSPRSLPLGQQPLG